jgi:hypothetical protein
VEFFRSFRYKILSPVNRDILTTSLLICIPFISSSRYHVFSTSGTKSFGDYN